MNNNISKILIGTALHFAFYAGTIAPALAANINFSGQLDSISEDIGNAVYSGVPVGTNFFGAIDTTTANGFISDGTTLTPFGCCIAAGGLSVSNNDVVDADTATLLNSLAGTNFVAGDLIDVINIEGDVSTAGGRIEIGLSFVLDPLAFDDTGLDNYPPDPNDILIPLFFIAEEIGQNENAYSAIGVIEASGDPNAQNYLRSVAIADDLNNNNSGDVVGLRVTNDLVIQARVSDGQTGEIVREQTFFNNGWRARDFFVVPGIGTVGRDAIAVVATRVVDELLGIQIKDTASGGAISTLFPWSAAWELVDVEVITGLAGGLAKMDGTKIATLARRRSDGLPGVELRDPITGTRDRLIYPLGFGFTPLQMEVIQINGTPAVAALHTRDSDGLAIVQVRNASDGSFIRNVFPLGLGWSPQELKGVADLNNNNADEVAVRMTRDSDGLEIIQIRDSLTQALIGNVYPIGAGLSTWTTQQFEVVNTNNIIALGILSTRDVDGQVLVQIRNPLTAGVMNNVFFIPPPWRFQQAFSVMPNFSGGGDDDELAVLMRNGNDGTGFIQIRDSQTDAVITNVFQLN